MNNGTNVGHEKSDMDPKLVLYFGISLTVAVILIHFGVWLMFRQFEHAQAALDQKPAVASSPQPQVEPRLQVSPNGDLLEMRKEEDEVLKTYRWIDRDKGIARIPIDRAMQLFLEEQKK